MATAQLNAQVEAFVTKLKRRQILGAYPTSVQTLHLLRSAISTT